MKKTIDEWLFWAYRDQLPLLAPDWRGPDEFGEGWNKVGSWSVGGTNRYGVVHALDQRRVCAPLAIALADRVLSLDDVAIALPVGWNPCEDFDMAALGPEGAGLAARAAAQAMVTGRDGERRMKRPVSDIVRRYALTGQAPAWECERPVRDMVRNWNGEPRWFVKARVPSGEDAFGNVIYSDVEREGWNVSKRRPFPNAYRKYVLTPCPLPGLVERAEYEVLVAALAVLVDEWDMMLGFAPGPVLQGGVLPSELLSRPWVVAKKPTRRVLRVSA